MRFTAPWRLLALAVPIVLAVIYVLMQRRRSEYAVRFTNLELLDVVAPDKPGRRRHLPAIALLAGMGLLAVALGRPVQRTEVSVNRATVVLALDVSLSMEANDVQPSRLEAMQRAVISFLESAPKGIAVGLVTFAGSAQLRVPPTTDRAELLRAVDNIKLQEYTAIGEAIFTSLNVFQDRDAAAKTAPAAGAPSPDRIVVMSDGKTTVGRSNDEAAAAAKQAGIPVSTIAFGTASGTVEREGQTIDVPVDGPALQAIATATGGKFVAASSQDQLAKALADLGTRGEQQHKDRDLTPWFIGLSMLILVLGATGSLLWFSRLP
ncbi:MAG: von Willebrand factor [Acidimicrobiia bacterium]|nr:von Willebrand factor [Acidimicrobiia bacterium]